MKRKIFFYSLILLMGFQINLFAKTPPPINIPIYGRAGLEINGDNIKICPGFKFNKCAVITVTWDDIFKSKENQECIVTVVLYDNNQNIAKIITTNLDKINNSQLKLLSPKIN